MRPMAFALGRKPRKLIGVLIEVEVQRHARAAELADDGGRGSAGGAGQGLAAVAEDEDGVENDVHDSAHQLAYHVRWVRPAGPASSFSPMVWVTARSTEQSCRYWMPCRAMSMSESVRRSRFHR